MLPVALWRANQRQQGKTMTGTTCSALGILLFILYCNKTDQFLICLVCTYIPRADLNHLATSNNANRQPLPAEGDRKREQDQKLLTKKLTLRPRSVWPWVVTSEDGASRPQVLATEDRANQQQVLLPENQGHGHDHDRSRPAGQRCSRKQNVICVHGKKKDRSIY